MARREMQRRATGEGGRSALILQAAMALFVREGGAAFTARRVAKEAGVSLGSVQYLYPTKHALLRAMLEALLAEYEAMYTRVAAALPFNGEARLLGVVEFLVQDTWRADTRRFFFNFYALSCHDEFTSALLNQTYAHHRRRLAGYIGAARPALSEQECFDLALQLSSLIDGLMIFTAAGSGSMSRRSRLTDLVKTTVCRWLDAAVSTPASRASATATTSRAEIAAAASGAADPAPVPPAARVRRTIR